MTKCCDKAARILELEYELEQWKQFAKYQRNSNRRDALSFADWAALTAKVEAVGAAAIAQFLFSNGWHHDGYCCNGKAHHVSSETNDVRLPVGDRTFADAGVCAVECVGRIARALGVGAHSAVELIEGKEAD
jgi:hypothetical protein